METPISNKNTEQANLKVHRVGSWVISGPRALNGNEETRVSVAHEDATSVQEEIAGPFITCIMFVLCSERFKPLPYFISLYSSYVGP
jgi:hypothetical protein